MGYFSLKVEKLRTKNEYTALALGNYADSIRGLIQAGFKPVNFEKAAEHRINLGIFHQIAWTGTRTTDFFVSQDDEFFLAKGNLRSLFFDPEAVDTIQDYHRNWNEITFNENYVTDMIPVPVDGITIPLQEFVDNPIANFLFGAQTKAYAEWLKEAAIPAFPIVVPNFSLTSRYENDFIRPLILRCTDNWSGLITSNADLHTEYGFRGYANHYSGELKPVETFSRDRLEIVNKMVPLEDRDYTLDELEQVFRPTPFKHLFNPVLRVVRNGGSLMPAHFGTWDN